MLPIEFDAAEQRTHDYRRHGTTNLFAALNVATGEVAGECRPSRDGTQFLAFLRKAVAPVQLHFTPKGSSWMNQIETWFGIITKQAIRRGTFTSVQVLIRTIRDYITTWNANPPPFQWTATANEILAKVQLVQTTVRRLVANNAK